MIATAATALLGLGSAIYGAVSSSAANNRARRLIQQQRDENKRWYDTRMSQDYTMRSDVQAAINRQRELLNEQYNRARKTQVVSGGSDEAVALQKEAANRSLSDTMTDVASQAAAYKDRVESQYRAQDAALNQQQVQSHQQQAAQTAQAASQAVNAAIGLTGNLVATKNSGNGTTSAPEAPAGNAQLGDLTAVGNAQLGITSDGLPQPADVSGPVRKKFA